MKSDVLFMIFCVLTSLVLSNVREVEAVNFGCNLTTSFPGKCGNNGNTACVNDVKKNPHAPKNLNIRYDVIL
ncbi:hypothetical protein EUTSA_v10029258mg, partial [Eutrema salsugineum]